MDQNKEIESLKEEIKELRIRIANQQRKIDDYNNLENLLNTVVDSIAGIHWWKDMNGVYRGCNTAMV